MRGFAHSPSVLVVSRILVGLLTLSYVLVLARELGPAGRGITAAIFAVSAVLPSVTGMGLPLAVRRRTKIGRADEAFSAAIQLLNITSPVALLSGVAIGLLFRPFLTTVELLVTVFLFSLSPLLVVMRLSQQMLLGRENYLKQAISLLSLSLGIALSLNFFFLFSTVTVLTALISQCVGLFFALVLSLLLAKPRWSRTAPGPLFREARGYWPRDALREIRERADQLLVFPLLGAASAGIYSVALLVAMLPDVVAGAIGIMVFHKIRNSTLPNSSEVAAHLRVGLMASVLAALPLVLVSPWLIPRVFGEAFTASIGLTVLMLLTITPVSSMIAVLENALNSLGLEKTMSSGEALILGTALLLSLLLAPAFGVVGVVAGFTVGGLSGVLVWSSNLRVTVRDFTPSKGDWLVFQDLFRRPDGSSRR